MSIDQYEYIDFPGDKDIRIPICKKTLGDAEEQTGIYTPDWMISIDDAQTASTIAGYETYAELMGWYCESARHVKGDSADSLRTGGTLWHSDVFLALENGVHNAYINRSVADGTITPTITLVRLMHVNGAVQTLQTLTFSTCHWVGVHTHLDWIFARFTACKRENKVAAFNQDGSPRGNNTCIINYETNEATAG